MKRALSGIVLLVPLALLACESPTDSGEDLSSTQQADAPNLASSGGITVTAIRWITARTIEADISTPLIASSAINGPHRIRATLPNDYFKNPTNHYPVVYLLHGGAGGNSAQWTTGGGVAEAITENQPVITVMPDGGKVGWFTNWVSEARGPQRWADFYVNQVIPWVDANFRTIPTKQGRAIAGLSMGGFGAMRLAQDRPDLFASVASFSGAVDLGDMATRITIGEQCVQNGYLPSGPFGSPWWPLDKTWKELDPMKRVKNLTGLQILLYAGSGINDADIVERTVGQSSDRFSKTLSANGIPHFWWMYGRPGPSAPFACDGGHNFSCWNLAFNDALPRMLTVLQHPPAPPPPPPPPPGVNVVANGDFEAAGSWQCTGNCGRDSGSGLAHGGSGNGWVRNGSGWNDTHQKLTVAPNTTYQVTAWVKTSANLTDGYFGIRTANGQVVGEKKFGRLDNYTQLSVTVNSGANTQLVVYGGIWANGDTFFQIDDVSVVGQ